MYKLSSYEMHVVRKFVHIRVREGKPKEHNNEVL
jgi:hypothetical protein